MTFVSADYLNSAPSESVDPQLPTNTNTADKTTITADSTTLSADSK